MQLDREVEGEACPAFVVNNGDEMGTGWNGKERMSRNRIVKRRFDQRKKG